MHKRENSTVPVSVVVPSYNSAYYLEECIISINSGIFPAEILIVDDSSTDNSFEIARSLAKRYENIRLLRRETNGGAIEARRMGVYEAVHDFIAFVDADDLLEANAIHDAYVRMINSGADVCLWDLWGFDGEKQWRNIANPKDFPLVGSGIVFLTLGQWRIHAFGIYKRSILEKAYNEFNETFFLADELLTRISFSYAELVVGSKIKCFQRLHSQSSTQTLNVRRLTSLRRHLWMLDFVQRFPNPPMDGIIREALAEAWFYWTERRQVGLSAALREIRILLTGLYRTQGLFLSLSKSPKYFGCFIFLSIAVWIPF